MTIVKDDINLRFTKFFRDGKEESAGGTFGMTPAYGSQTPMYGSRTPMYGAQTPMYDGE